MSALLGKDGCQVCPRRCSTDRTVVRGVCGAPRGIEVSAVCLHRGEEPPLVGAEGKGIVNVFFAHCNLHCVFCQNEAISSHDVADDMVHYSTLDAVADRVVELLPDSCGLMGLVTPTHYAHLVPSLVQAVHDRGFYPTVVYNCGGYESVETLKTLEGTVDIYLPDLKYMLPDVALALSHASDYPQVALDALREMARQVGRRLMVCDGTAFRGLMVRHLVLPGMGENTRACIQQVASLLGTGASLSLMAQYFPPNDHLPKPLDRCLTDAEYAEAVQCCDEVGLVNVYTQELDAHCAYRPDFSKKDHPFE